MSRFFEHFVVPQPPYRMKRPLATLASMEAPEPNLNLRADKQREEWERRMDEFEKLENAKQVDTKLVDIAQAAALALEEGKSSRRSDLLRAVAEAGEQYAEGVKAGGGELQLDATQKDTWQRLMLFKKHSDAGIKAAATRAEKRQGTEPAAPIQPEAVGASAVETPAIATEATTQESRSDAALRADLEASGMSDEEIEKLLRPPAPSPASNDAALRLDLQSNGLSDEEIEKTLRPPAPPPPPEVSVAEAASAAAPEISTSKDGSPARGETLKTEAPVAEPNSEAAAPEAPEVPVSARSGRGPRINLQKPAELPAERVPSSTEALRRMSREAQRTLNEWRGATEKGDAVPREELERLRQAYKTASERLVAVREAARARRGASETSPSAAPEAPREAAIGRALATAPELPASSAETVRTAVTAETLPPAPELPPLPDERMTLEEIQQMGETETPGFWDRWSNGFAGEWSDWKAGINSILAGRQRERLTARNKRIEEWQKKADALNTKKGIIGKITVLMFHEGRILANKRKGAAEFAKWEAYNNKRLVNEREGDELRAFASKPSERLIASFETRAEAARRQAELRSADLDHLYHQLGNYERCLAQEDNDETKNAVRAEMSTINERIATLIQEKAAFDTYMRKQRALADAEHRESQEILTKSDRTARPDTTPPTYDWLTAQAVRGKSPKLPIGRSSQMQKKAA
jgi:hypothetical protein